MAVKPPLKTHGGKHYLAAKLIALMPSHLHYVEPYFGGGAVMLAKDPEGVSEVANDIDRRLMNFWRVLQDPNAYIRFLRRVAATPFSEVEWRRAHRSMRKVTGDIDVKAAVSFFIDVRQSRQGLTRDFATLSRNRTRRGMNEQASAWLSALDGLTEVHARLQRIVIRYLPAVTVMLVEDGPNTLFYCDPPYFHSTRSTTDAYRHEMETNDHAELLSVADQCQGHVMISGYPNPLYDRELVGWNRHDFRIDNKASGASTKRIVTESVWCNF